MIRANLLYRNLKRNQTFEEIERLIVHESQSPVFTISDGALASKFEFKSASLADGHTLEAQSSMSPIQQSVVAAKNVNKSATSKYEVKNDIGHFPKEKNNWSEEHFVDILAICKREQFSEDHSGEA